MAGLARRRHSTYIIYGREIDAILYSVALELPIVVDEDITVRVVERDGIAAFSLAIRYGPDIQGLMGLKYSSSMDSTRIAVTSWGYLEMPYRSTKGWESEASEDRSREWQGS